MIVRDDLVGKARPNTPTMLDWATHASNESMYNTPPCWSIYMCGLVFKKLLNEGGLPAMYERNAAKAKVRRGGGCPNLLDKNCESSVLNPVI